jgi:hypothetical protein
MNISFLINFLNNYLIPFPYHHFVNIIKQINMCLFLSMMIILIQIKFDLMMATTGCLIQNTITMQIWS